MKNLVRAAAALMLALFLVFPAAPVLAQPAQQQLRVGVWSLPPSRGNPYGGRSLPSTFVWDAVFDPLVRIGANGSIVPVLALSWELREPTVWRFKLRPKVTFHNGTPFNADAVVATITWLTTQAGRASAVGTETRELAAATKVDDLTVDIRTTVPDPLLPNRLAMMSIVEPKLWAQGGPEGFANAPVGTGSFKLESFSAGAANLVAYSGAWRKARVKSVRIIDLPERPARLQALTSGQIDIAFGLAPDQLVVLKRLGLQVISTPAPQVMSLAFITEGKESPLKDQRVRLAMNHAVNKQLIADQLLAGLGRPAGQGGTAAAFGYDSELKPIPYDPARARALLKEAGYPNGFAMVAEVTVDAFPADSEIYQQMAFDLDAVGIRVELRQIRFPDWLKKFLGGGWEGIAYGSSWNTAPFMDTIRPYLIFSCLKKPSFFCDQSVVPLIQEASREFDPKKRLPVLRKLHAETQRNPSALFLVEQVDLTGVSAKVDGVKFVNRTVSYDTARFK